MRAIADSLPVASYGVAVGVIAIAFLYALFQQVRGAVHFSLFTALIGGVCWSAYMTYAAASVSVTLAHLFYVEISHDVLWLLFLSSMFSGALESRWLTTVRFGSLGLAAGFIVLGVAMDLTNRDSGDLLVGTSIMTSFCALSLLEQAYRNGRESQRSGLKFIAIGLGSLFAYDLFLYSDAILAGRISDLLWNVRGFVAAMCIPIFLYGLSALNTQVLPFFVSRKVVTYSATMIGTGIYLIVVGLSGYYIGNVGGQWGAAVQVIGLFAATLVLVVLLFSRRLRAQINVFVKKHFYRSKYDYREEWLRLMQTLTEGQEGMSLRKRCIKALAQIQGADRGWLWLQSEESKTFECVSGWNAEPSDGWIASDSDFAKHLEKSGWIVDVQEPHFDSDTKDSLELEQLLSGIEDASKVIPLINDDRLLGFIVASHAPVRIALTYEELDLLKTAGRQIASYLAQDLVTEDLAKSRQFEAVNRLTTFLMHDLKNLVAQQSMIVENAKRFRRNPDFVDDAIDTISNSVARMKHVLQQLGRAGGTSEVRKVGLIYPASNAIDRCAAGEPKPELKCHDSDVEVMVDDEQFSTVLQHLIRNSQDATAADGEISVVVRRDAGGGGIVEVADSGSGMSSDFIRDRLFKPFDSTKGARGMGIGVYQAREFIRSMGGELRVSSTVGAGTVVSVELPEAGNTF